MDVPISNDDWLQSLVTLKDSMRIHLNGPQVEFENAMLRSAYHFLYHGVKKLAGDSQEQWDWHYRILYNWMTKVSSLGMHNTIASGSEAWASDDQQTRQSLVDYLNSTGNASAQLTIRVGQNFTSLFRSELTQLELVTQDDLLNRYYMEYPKLKDRTYKHLAQVAGSYARAHADVRILEVGAGTGGATKVVLEAFDEALQDADDERFLHYTFTDVTPSFFLAAKTKLAQWIPDMEFKKLNIEEDPESQGFAPGTYDLVVASLVLHATKSLHRTLAHVRRLLRPGGALLLIETTRDVIDMQLVFGTFPGWWLSEEEDRKMSPNVATNRWHEVMRDSGFTGVEFEIGDCEEVEYQSTSLLITNAHLNMG